MSIRSVGDVPVLPRHRLSCHCGSVVLELDLPDGIVDPRRCDCSICRRKGAVVASVPLAGIRVLQGEEHLKLYQFNKRVAKHYFCSNCGIYTHHQRRSFPDQYGYNVGCLEGINPFLLTDVPVNDGINHPADRPRDGAARAGRVPSAVFTRMEARMRRVTGIGGVFFKAKDPEALGAWYRTHLGLNVEAWGGVAFRWSDDNCTGHGTTIWSPVKDDATGFAPSTASFMINYRVEDLHALLDALRAEGCRVDDRVEESELGKFGWVFDPEGNKVELWQPPPGR